jgi:hypothetical protein
MVLNQKVDSKLSGAVNFALRFVIIIENKILNFKFIKIMNLDVKLTAPENFEPTFWFKPLFTSPPPRRGGQLSV